MGSMGGGRRMRGRRLYGQYGPNSPGDRCLGKGEGAEKKWVVAEKRGAGADCQGNFRG